MFFCAGMERNFRSYPNGVTDTLNQPYDLRSIMHYGNKAFSKNDGDTIISRRYPSVKLGAKREKLSNIDASQLNQLYKCKTRPRRNGHYGKFFRRRMYISSSIRYICTVYNS